MQVDSAWDCLGSFLPLFPKIWKIGIFKESGKFFNFFPATPKSISPIIVHMGFEYLDGACVHNKAIIRFIQLHVVFQRFSGLSYTELLWILVTRGEHIMIKANTSLQVNDLEVELETAKQKGRENLQQALSIERERFTQMQWDMEELRRKSLEMELKLKSEKVYCYSPFYLKFLFSLMVIVWDK